MRESEVPEYPEHDVDKSADYGNSNEDFVHAGMCAIEEFVMGGWHVGLVEVGEEHERIGTHDALE